MALVAFLAAELAPTRRRFAEATRTALKATLTTGIAAIAQTVGPFGPLFAFRIGQPGVSFGLFEGALTIICAAAMQAAIVPITGQLLDYPGLILAFLFVVFATIAYLLSNTKLFLILALVAIGTITTVYVGIFKPGRIGWGSAYIFDGILIATLVLVAFDIWIWPSPPEPKLLEALAADLERSRRRLELVGQFYLDPTAGALPTAQLASRLAANLTLLKSVAEYGNPTPQRIAMLVEEVTTAERVFLEVERLATLAEEPISTESGRVPREEIETALKILDSTLAGKAQEVLAGLPDSGPSAESMSDMRIAIARLNKLGAEITVAAPTTAFSSSNLPGFLDALEVLAHLLEPREPPVETAATEDAGADDSIERPPLIDATRMRFSIKLAATIVLGLLVGLVTQRVDLQTILWSIAVTGQPNQYGGVLRKTFLRLGGCLIGGLATLVAMRIVSQNFDSLLPYLVAIFAVMVFSAYVSQSSELLGYAGIQTGITFLICYVGLAPSSNVYAPLWRFWGIVLGVVTSGFVFLLLLPEYATDKLVESLTRMMRTTLAFSKRVADGTITEGQIAATERSLSTELMGVLNMASQARLEGTTGIAMSATGIEVATLLIRIAYRFQVIARVRLAGAEASLPHDALERRTALEREYCVALESELDRLESSEADDESTELLSRSTIESMRLSEQLTTESVSKGGEELTHIQLGLASQLESYHRLPILLAQLGTALSKAELR
jgi:uncharacterized membrane protein YccC